MNREEFIKYIESIGFEGGSYYFYSYKDFKISLYYDHYTFWNGSYWIDDIPFNDLKPLLKLIRSIKLKSILK